MKLHVDLIPCGSKDSRSSWRVQTRYASDSKLKIIPVRLAEEYPPRPYGEGRRQNEQILKDDM